MWHKAMRLVSSWPAVRTRIDTYRGEGPPPAEQRMNREEIRTWFGV
jgi:hypothetical protein